MDPDNNRFVPLREETPEEAQKQKRSNDFTRDLHAHFASTAKAKAEARLLRPDGSPVPEHWGIYTVGELVVLKAHTFRVAHIGEAHLLLEPVGPALVGEGSGALR